MTSFLSKPVRSGIGRVSSKIDGPTGIPPGIGTTPSEKTDRQKLGQFALVAKRGSIHLVNSPTLSVSTESSQATAVASPESSEPPAPERWHELKLDTNQLFPYAFKGPPLKGQKPLAGGFRARIRRTAQGILIRIIRKLGDEVEEVADIAFRPSNDIYELDGVGIRRFELDTSCPQELPSPWARGGLTTATRDGVELFDSIFDISPYPTWASGPSSPFTPLGLGPTDLGGSEEPTPVTNSTADDPQSEQESTSTLITPENGPISRRVSTTSSFISVHSSNSQHQLALTSPISHGASDDSQSLYSQGSYRLPTPNSIPNSVPTSPLYPKSPPSPSFSFISEEPDALIGKLDRNPARSDKPKPKPKPLSRCRPPPITTEPEAAAANKSSSNSQIHHNTLGATSSLTATYQDRGLQGGAETLDVKVLEGQKKELGDAHPGTLRAVANLAASSWNQGRTTEAEALEVEAFEARKKGLGGAASHPEPETQRWPTSYVRKTNMATDEGESSDTASTNPPTSSISRHGSLNDAMANTALPSYDTRGDRGQDCATATRRPDLPSVTKTGTGDRGPRLEGPQDTESDGLLQRAETRSPISSSGALTNSIVIHRRLNKWVQATAYDYDGHDWTLGNDFDASNIEETQLTLPFLGDKIAADPVSSSMGLGSLARSSQRISPPLYDGGQISSLGSLYPSGRIEAAQDTLSQRSNDTEVSQEHASDTVSQGYPAADILGTGLPDGNVFRHRTTDSQSTGILPSPTTDDISLAGLPAQTPISAHHSIEGSNVAELSVEPDISSLGIDKTSQILLLPGPDTEFEQTNTTTRALQFQASIFRYIKLISIAVSTNLIQLAQYFLHRQQTKLCVPAGRVRIKWRCKCGQQLFDDFVESRPGAARDLEDHLNRHPQNGTGSPTSSNSGSLSGADSGLTHPSTQTSLSSASFGDIGLSRASQYSPGIRERDQSAVVPLSGYSEPRWLLTCASGERYDTRLYHVDVNAVLIKSDRDLAVRLKQQYSQLRAPWHQILRLRGLTTIQFVQFEVHRSRAVDIRKCPDMPPPSSANYIFAPSDLLPPVGENYLMHLFHHPQDYDDEYITYVRLPKKCGTRLRVLQNRDVEIGWGISLVEGFQATRVWAMAVGVFLTSSLVFGAAWASKKGDLSGAFGVSAWICMVPILLIGLIQAYWE